MPIDLGVRLLRIAKCSVKEYLGWWGLFLDRNRTIELFELVVYDLQGVLASFLDLPVEFPTVVALICFPAFGINLLADLGSP